ncbi:unnamed protein product, partial [Clonostachys solani]
MNIYEGKNELKVIVVGGGIAGLSLANMLEKANINYILLEAHTDLTPQISLGAILNSKRSQKSQAMFSPAIDLVILRFSRSDSNSFASSMKI